MAPENTKGKLNEELLELIAEKMEPIDYGTLTLVLHEGKVVQIETSVKTRLE